jgi:tetratricopeptide (TPR) repeat protein
MNFETFDQQVRRAIEAHDWRTLVDLFRSNEGLAAEIPGFWGTLIEHLNAFASQLPKGRERSDLLLACGRVWQRHIGDSHNALLLFQQSWQSYPENVEPLALAREIYEQDGRVDMVIRLFEAELDVTKDPIGQASILTDLARLFLYRLQEPKKAAERLELSLVVNPDDRNAQELLAVARRALEEGVVRPPSAGPEPIPAPLGEVAEKTVVMQSLPTGALAVAATQPDGYEEEPAELAPEASGAPEEPAEAPDDAIEGEATPDLEGLGDPIADYAELEPEPEGGDPDADDEIEAPGEPEAGEAPAEPEAGEPEAGEPEAGEPEIGEAPAEPEAIEPAAAEPEGGDDGPEADDEDPVPTALSGPHPALRAESGPQDMRDPDERMAEYREVLARDPDDFEALSFARSYYRERGEWETLRDLYEAALAKRGAAKGGFDVQGELADILWRHLDDAKQAEIHFKRLRLRDPKNPHMLAFYADAYRKEGDHKRLVSTLKSLRAEVEDPAERLAVGIELAELSEHQLGQPDRAMDVWKTVAQENPGHERAGAELRRLYNKSGKYNALLEFLRGEAKACRPDEGRRHAALLFEIADLYRERLALPQMEVNTLVEITQVDPGNAAAIDQLVARYEADESWEELVGILEQRAAHEASPEAEVEVRRNLARLCRQRLADLGRTVVHLERVVALEPADGDALRELRAIYEAREEHSPLLRVLEKQAALAEGPERTALLEEQLRVAADVLGDDEETAAAARALLEATDDTHVRSLSVLEAIYRRQSQWPLLIGVLQAQRALASAPEAEIAILLRIGELHDQALGDVDAAVAAYEAARALDPTDEPSIARLESLFLRAERWDALEALCGERGEWERCFDLLDGAVRGRDAEAALGLFRRMARVAESELDDARRAVSSYEAVLSLAPADAAAAAALVPYYEASASHAKLPGVLAILADAAEPAEALALCMRIAGIHDQELHDGEQALGWVRRATRLVPTDPPARALLERLSRAQGALPEALALLDEEAARAEGEARQALLLQAARIAFRDLRPSHATQAISLYDQLLAEDPPREQALEALEALEVLHGEAAAYEALVDVLQRRGALLDPAKDAADLVSIRLRIAAVQADQLGDTASAVATYRSVLAGDPTNTEALELLKLSHARSGEWSAVAEVAARQAEVDADLRPAALLEIGRVRREHLDDLPGAIEIWSQLCEESLESDEAAEAIGTLREHLDGDGPAAEIAAVLEPAYRGLGRWVDLAHTVERRVAVSEERDERLAGLQLLVELYETSVGDAAAAFDAALRLAREDSSEVAAWDQMERLAGPASGWPRVAGFYREAVAAAPTDEDRARRLGRALGDKLGAVGEAIEVWRRIHGADQTDVEACEALERLYAAAGETDALVTLLLGRVAHAADDDRAKFFLFRMCEALESAGRPLDALPYYQRIFNLDETDTRAFDALRGLYEATEDWKGLGQLLLERIDVAPAEELAELRLHLGSLRESSLDDLPGAVEMYRAVLNEEVDNVVASQAMEALSRDGLQRPELAELRGEIYDALAPVYEQRTDWDAALRLEELQLADPARSALRATHHRRAAQILSGQLDRPEDAFEHLAAALRLDYADEEVRFELERLAELLGGWDTVVAEYEAGLASLSGDEHLALVRRLAQINDQERQDVAAAIAYFRRVRDALPEDREALDELERLLEAPEQCAELVSVRAAKADLLEGAERTQLLRLNAAAQRETLSSPEDAVTTYSVILAENPEDPEALDALEVLNQDLQRWPSLAEILAVRAGLAEAPQDRKRILHRLAALQEQQLRDRPAAIATCRDILDLDADDTAALVALERLYYAQSEWESLAEVLERQLRLAGSAELENNLRFKLGNVRAGHLRDLGGAIALFAEMLVGEAPEARAVGALETAVDDEEHGLAAIEALLVVYERRAQWADLVRILEARAATVEAPEEKLASLERIQMVSEDRLGDVPGALSAACRIYVASPTPAAREELERLSAAAGDWQALATTYDAALPAIEDPETRVSVALRLGALHRDQLGDDEASEAAYVRVLSVDADNLDALGALEAIYSARGDGSSLLEIYERRVALALAADDRGEALAYLHRAIDVRLDRAEPEAAIETALRCVELDPRDPVALDHLDALYRAGERWQDVAALLRDRIERLERPEDAAPHLHELGVLQIERLDEAEAAVDTFAGLLARVRFEPTIRALEVLLDAEIASEGGAIERIASILEPVYRDDESHEDLVRVLLLQARTTADEHRQADVLSEAASLQADALGAPAQAYESWCRVTEVAPDRGNAWQSLQILAGPLQQWADLARRIEEERELERLSAERLVPLLIALGQIYEDELDDIGRAEAAYRDVLASGDDDNLAALEALERITILRGEWEELAEIFQRRVSLAGDAVQRHYYLVRLGRLCEDVLFDTGRAVSAYQQALAELPGDLGAGSALERLLEFDLRYEELAALLTQRAESTSDPVEKVGLLLRLGSTLARDLGEYARAVPVYQEILELDPSHTESLQILESLLQRLRELNEAPLLRETIVDVLEAAYGDGADWQRRIALCEARLEVARDVEDRVEALHKAARLAEEAGGSRERAFAYYSRALLEAPGLTRTIKELERIASATGDYSELARAYSAGLRKLDDPAMSVKVLLRLAEIYESALADKERAMHVLERLLEVEPYHNEALSTLERLLREASRYEKLADVLRGKAEASDDVLDQKEYLYQVAALREEKLNDPVGASEVFRRILELDPEDMVALESLEPLLRKTENFEELVNLLLVRVELVDDEVEKRVLQLEIAEVYEQKLDDLYSAADIFRGILAEEPEDRDAIAALDRLYEASERWADLLDIMDVERRLAADEDEQNRIDFRAASVMEQAIGDVPRAIEVYRVILARSPHFEPALAALDALVGGEYGAQAGAALETLYREWGEWEAIVALMERRLEQVKAPAKRHQILRDIAELEEKQLERPQRAFKALARAFAERPEEFLPDLARLADEQQLWGELAKVLDEAASANQALARDLRMRSAEIHRVQLASPASAAERYRRVIADRPEDREALGALDELYTEQSQWAELVEVLRAEIALADAEEERNELTERLAHLLATVFHQEGEAIELYEALLGSSRKRASAVESLARLVGQEQYNARITPLLADAYRQDSDWNGLANLYRTALTFRREPSERAQLYTTLAKLHRDKLEDPAKAFSFYAHSLQEVPTSRETRDRLEALCETLGSYQQLAALYDDVRKRVEDATTRIALTKKVAAWCDQKLGRLDVAEARYRELLELDPQDGTPLEALTALYDRTENHAGSVSVRWTRLERTRDAGARAELLQQIVAVAEGPLQDLRAALKAYEALARLQPENAEITSALVRLYDALGEWGRLADALEAQARSVEDDGERGAIWRRLGDLARRELGDLPRAAAAFREARTADPEDPALFEALEAIYTELGEWTALRDLLHTRLERSQGAGKLEVIRPLADLYLEQFQRTDDAIALFRDYLAEEPESQPALIALSRLHERAGQWEALAQVYEKLEAVLAKVPEAERDAGTQVSLFESLARLQLEHLGDKRAASETFQRLLAVDPTHRAALDTLSQLQEEQEDWAGVLRSLDARIGLEDQPVRAAALYARKANALRKLGAESGKVRDALEHALRLDPARLDAAAALRPLYEQARSWESLWSVTALLAQSEREPSERKARSLELAAIARDHLDDPVRLVQALEAARTLDPSDLHVVDELAEAYVNVGRMEEAAPLLRDLLAARGEVANRKERARLHTLMGRVARGAGDFAAAEEQFRTSYGLDSTYLPNLSALGQLLFQRGELDEALKLYQVMLLHQMSLKNKGERVDIHFHMGEIYRLQGDRKRARDLYLRALSIDPTHEPSKHGVGLVE